MLKITSATAEVCLEVDKTLRQLFGKQLFFPKEVDKARLLKLKMWSDRYKVSLSYILGKLVPRFEKMASKHARSPRVKVSKGIGTTIAVLTGQAAEEFLKDCIAKDYPDQENVLAWKEDKREETLRLLDGEELVVRPRKILSFKSVAAYTDAYRQKMEKQRQSTAKREAQLSKQPYRGNPWR